MLTLWPFQQEALEAVNAHFSQGVRRTIVSMPTGTGKTVLLVFLVDMALRARKRCLIVVHTKELVDQTFSKLASVGIIAGVVKQESDDWQANVVIAQVQTLSRVPRLHAVPRDAFDMLIVDECHLANAKTYQRLLRWFGQAWMIGLTATPFRGDKDSLAWAHFAGQTYANWQSIAYVYPVWRAIREGYLARPTMYRVWTEVSLDSVDLRNPADGGEADFKVRDLQHKVDTPARNAAIVTAYLKHCQNQRAIAFCVTQQHAKSLANAFRKEGVEAWRLKYDMPELQRDAITTNHRKGRFPVITNCAVLTHGYDDPDLQCVIMARPTLSKTLFMQCIGRAMRPGITGTKSTCSVLAALDTCTQHKLAINDELWTLEEEMSRQTPAFEPMARATRLASVESRRPNEVPR